MKNRINNLLEIILFSILLLVGCKEDNDDFVGNDNYIISFKLIADDLSFPAIITNNSITVTVDASTDLSQATVFWEGCEHVTLSPDPASITDWGIERDFTTTSYNRTERTYHYSLVRTEANAKGDIILNTQAAVDAFVATKVNTINGNLSIGTEESEEDPITNLDGLQTLREVKYILTFGQFCSLEKIVLENLQRAGAIQMDDLSSQVLNVALPNLEVVSMNLEVSSSKMTELTLTKLTRVDGDMSIATEEIEEILLPVLTSVGGELLFKSVINRQGAKKLQKISLPILQSIGKQLYCNTLKYLTAINIPVLRTAGGILINNCAAITTLSCPALEKTTAYGINANSCPNLTSYSFPSLKSAWSITCNSYLTSLDFSALATVKSDLTISSMTLTDLSIFSKLETVEGTLVLDGVKDLIFSFDKLGTLKSVGGLTLKNIAIDGGVLNLSHSGISGNITLSGSSMLIDKLIGPDRLTGTLSLDNSSGTKLPVIEGFRIIGGLTINANPSDAVSLSVEEITGNLNLNKLGRCPSFEMTNLKSVGGEFKATITSLTAATSFILPKLTSVGGNMTIETGKPGAPQSIGMPELTKIKGNLFIGPTTNIEFLKPNAAITSLNFGKLTSVLSVTINNLTSLTDFHGFSALVPYIDGTQWNVTLCGYNPKYKDLEEGHFTKQ